MRLAMRSLSQRTSARAAPSSSPPTRRARNGPAVFQSTRRSIKLAGTFLRYSVVQAKAYRTRATSCTHWVARLAAAETDSPRQSAVPKRATMRGILAGNPKRTFIDDHDVDVGTWSARRADEWIWLRSNWAGRTKIPDASLTRRSVRASWWLKSEALSPKYGAEKHAHAHATTGGMSTAVALSVTFDRRAAVRYTHGASSASMRAARSVVTPAGGLFYTEWCDNHRCLAGLLRHPNGVVQGPQAPLFHLNRGVWGRPLD